VSQIYRVGIGIGVGVGVGVGVGGGNENLREGIYPTCRNISSARSLTLYSDLFYASESGSALLQFRKVSRLPRVACTPRARDFGNLGEPSGCSDRSDYSTGSSLYKRTRRPLEIALCYPCSVFDVTQEFRSMKKCSRCIDVASLIFALRRYSIVTIRIFMWNLIERSLKDISCI